MRPGMSAGERWCRNEADGDKKLLLLELATELGRPTL